MSRIKFKRLLLLSSKLLVQPNIKLDVNQISFEEARKNEFVFGVNIKLIIMTVMLITKF